MISIGIGRKAEPEEEYTNHNKYKALRSRVKKRKASTISDRV